MTIKKSRKPLRKISRKPRRKKSRKPRRKISRKPRRKKSRKTSRFRVKHDRTLHGNLPPKKGVIKPLRKTKYGRDPVTGKANTRPYRKKWTTKELRNLVAASRRDKIQPLEMYELGPKSWEDLRWEAMMSQPKGMPKPPKNPEEITPWSCKKKLSRVGEYIFYRHVSDDECTYLKDTYPGKFFKATKGELEKFRDDYRFIIHTEVRPHELSPMNLPLQVDLPFDPDVVIGGTPYKIKKGQPDYGDIVALKDFYEYNRDKMPIHIFRSDFPDGQPNPETGEIHKNLILYDDQNRGYRMDDDTALIEMLNPILPEHFSGGENGYVWTMLNSKYDQQHHVQGGRGIDGKKYDSNKKVFLADIISILGGKTYLTSTERIILTQIKDIVENVEGEHNDLKLENFVYNGSLQERGYKKYDPSGFGEHVLRRRFNVKLIDPLAPSDNP